MMEEDLVAVGARWNTHYVTVCFAAHSFRRMGFLKQLNHTEKINIYLFIILKYLVYFYVNADDSKQLHSCLML